MFRLLGDEVRLRLLRLLSQERLNVTELTGILGLAQSGVSRHLGLLKDAGLDCGGARGRLHLLPHPADLRDGLNGFGPLWPLLEAQFHGNRRDRGGAGRRCAARGSAARPRKENFDAHAGPDTNERQLVPGRSWAAWARALGHLLPPVRVADLGCGEGYLTVETSRWAARVIAVDRSPEVLKRARALAARRQVTNVIWKQGDSRSCPCATRASTSRCSRRRCTTPTTRSWRCVRRSRILVPGGRVLVLDLREHAEAWVRDRLGDKMLGFSDQRLARLLADAGLDDVRITTGARKSRRSVHCADCQRQEAGPAAAPSATRIHARRRRGAPSAPGRRRPGPGHELRPDTNEITE